MPIERFVKIPAGAALTQSHSLGELSRHSEEFRLRKLTVAPEFPYVEQITATLTLPGGVVVGPIDVPFTFNATSPVQVRIDAPSLANYQSVHIILADLPDSPNLYGATHWASVANNAKLAIPDACVAITLLTTGQTLTFYDSTPTAIGTATGSQLIARPRIAKTLAIGGGSGGSVLFHY